MSRDKTTSEYILLFLMISMVLGLLMQITPVIADEHDFAIKEGDEFRWQISKVDDDEYPEYQKDDIMTIKIQFIDYDEISKVWVITTTFLDFYEDEGEDKYNWEKYMVSNNGSYGYGTNFQGYFIPEKDMEEFLEDCAAENPDYSADGKEYTEVDSEIVTTWKFNSDGVVSKKTIEKDDDTILEFVLIDSDNIISFGISVLIIIPIGIFALVIITKRKRGVSID